MSAVETPTRQALTPRLLVLLAVLVFVIGLALGFNLLTIREAAGQAVQGLVGVIFTLSVGARR